MEVEDNYQLLLYTIGAIPQVEAKGLVVDAVMPVIIQPRAGGAREGALMDRKMIAEWQTFFKKAAKATQQKNAPLVAGEEQCIKGYCPMVGRCPAAQEMTMALARKEDWPDVVDTIDEDKFRLILERADFIRHLLEAAERVATERLLAGEKLQGFKLVLSKKHRKWIDDPKISEQLNEHLGDEAWMEPKLISPSQAERLFKAHRLDDTLLESWWEHPVGDPVLAREADRRPALDSETLTVVRQRLQSKSGS